jgi:hypothetical protein
MILMVGALLQLRQLRPLLDALEQWPLLLWRVDQPP